MAVAITDGTNADGLRCLSIRQPWAELILRGTKDVENRTWDTSHRGLLLVNAARRIESEAAREHGIESAPTGSIVGVVNVVDCTRTVSSPWHIPGMYGWYLKDPIRFTDPVPCRGALGLFRITDSVVRQAVEAALSAGAR